MQRTIAEQRLDLPGEIARQGGVFGSFRAFGRLSCDREHLPGTNEIRGERDARVPYAVPAVLLGEPVERSFTGPRRNVPKSVTALTGGLCREREIQLRFKKSYPGIREYPSKQDKVPSAEIARLHQTTVMRKQGTPFARGGFGKP